MADDTSPFASFAGLTGEPIRCWEHPRRWRLLRAPLDPPIKSADDILFSSSFAAKAANPSGGDTTPDAGDWPRFPLDPPVKSADDEKGGGG